MRRAPQLGLKAPAFATERHQLLMPAGSALHAEESVFEAPAFEVRLELFVDEVGERDTFGIKAFEKPREVLFDKGVEGSLLGAVTFVRGCVTGQSRSRAGGHLSSAVMGVGPGCGLLRERIYGTPCRVMQDTASPFIRVALNSAGSQNPMSRDLAVAGLDLRSSG